MSNSNNPFDSLGAYSGYANMSQYNHAQAAQNAGYGQMQNQNQPSLQDYFRQHAPRTTDELKAEIARLQAEVDKRELHTILPGPTNDELNKNPSLKESWEAYTIIRKLIGLK